MDSEFVLYLEDLDDFVSEILDDLECNTPEDHEILRNHWINYFAGESALIVDDEIYDGIMLDFERNQLNEVLRNLVFVEDSVELGWDSEVSDFTFRRKED